MNFLKRLADGVDVANDWVGRTFAWLTLCMVLVEFGVVMSRYVFGLGSTLVQESIVYMHATVFLVCAGYALVHNGHVRCDIFYSVMKPRTKALVDLACTLVFLLPMCVLIWWTAWPYVKASWAIMEVSKEGRLGIPAVYLQKTLILAFAVLLGVQGISLLIQSALVVAGVTSSRGRVDGDSGEPEEIAA